MTSLSRGESVLINGACTNAAVEKGYFCPAVLNGSADPVAKRLMT